ncbi:MAG: ABC transporter [Fluviicola sp.]|nr:MAG: ABC transporter [Fluviicola sp.]
MKSLSYLNKYLIKYKWRLLLGIVFIIGSNFFHVNMPLIVKDAVNQFDKNFDPENWLDLALSLGGIYILLSLGKGVFLFFTRQTIIIVSRYIEYDLKNEIYRQYQRLTYNFYKRNNTGDLMNRISEDVTKVRMYLGPGVMYTVNLVILFTFTIYAMINISGELTLYTLTPLPIMSFLVYKVSSRMNRQSERVQREQSKISTIVQESFSGITVLKAYGGEKRFQKNFDDSANTYLKKHMDLVKTNAFFMPTITFLIGISTILTIYLGGVLSFETQNSISEGDIVAFIFYVNMLTWPFASVGWVTSLVQRAAASQERINEFLKEEPEIKNNNYQPFNFDGKITFDNVSYTFESSGIEAIRNLSFEIKKGETLAILGRTGSGKSTVINLLMRQFDPIDGEIRIDDKPLPTVNIEEFRKQTGVVPQEVFLFSDSIRNNVKFGLSSDQNADDNDVKNVLKTAHVWHNIEEFKQGLDTVLGERGVNLSGGQKQRVSIARALIRKPKFLILDDCLSAVDTETEEIILGNIKDQIEKNTTLIVSHRVSSIRNADHILVLDNGRKIEEGSHEELLAKKGVYADMYTKQLLEDAEKSKEEE